MRDALSGLRLYQEAPRRPPLPEAPIVARAGRAIVRDYGASSPAGAPAVLFVPSIINSPAVLDIAEDNSLLRWLAGRGIRPLLVDWGAPIPDERDMSITGHVERLLVPLIDALAQPLTLVGYCLGGTMAVAAAALRPPRGLVLIAAPWRFAGFPDEAREGLATLWMHARPIAAQLGLLPVEVLQTAFWKLDPRQVVRKYARFATLDPAGDAAAAFVAVEDWANAGQPLTFAAGRELVEAFFGADVPGSGGWIVGGRAIDPAALDCPILDIASTSDRIVPHASDAAIGTRLALAQGHVGMIVGGNARERLWQPLAEWLRNPYP